MPQLLPHILLRTKPEGVSPAAVALRAAGYAVTKVGDNALALDVLAAGRIDAVVVDLPALHAINFARLLEESAPVMPALMITGWSEALRRVAPCWPQLTPDAVDESLVRAVDRMLADHELNLWRCGSAAAAAS